MCLCKILTCLHYIVLPSHNRVTVHCQRSAGEVDQNNIVDQKDLIFQRKEIGLSAVDQLPPAIFLGFVVV